MSIILLLLCCSSLNLGYPQVTVEGPCILLDSCKYHSTPFYVFSALLLCPHITKTIPVHNYKYCLPASPSPASHWPDQSVLTNHSRRPSQLTDCQPMRERPQLAGKFKYPQPVSPAEFEAENNWSFNSCSAGWVTLLDNTFSITISTLSGQLPLRYKSIQ